MKRSISQVRLLSIIRVGIAAQAHIPCHELSPGKRIRTTWIDENRDTDELFRMYLGESPVMELREDGSHRVHVYGDGRLLATADYAGPDRSPATLCQAARPDGRETRKQIVEMRWIGFGSTFDYHLTKQSPDCEVINCSGCDSNPLDPGAGRGRFLTRICQIVFLVVVSH